ncbi:uncharacterized protein LOC112046382 [Bicyclus anynana]|uniref:Uncharacterized protein LOC112046382 n=1 Tax=Bicyclus anynana TaxID=110368 RepID=A0A6J1N710_BICAN|nr:uncharacterized protein LOC112046382 [Bicyclus anynana]
MSDARQVKVDNWGIYFLQRLKHFFNRTDYCDLTLQFQDNAQLKVHRLVLSACTEYFELLERTCEMYEDCLVMPDDLQADVVVPIINFMYTGQLEFKQDLLEKLYQTSLIMNLPILTKLLDAHRPQKKQPPAKPAFSSSNSFYGKRYSKPGRAMPIASGSGSKRSFSSAFDNTEFQTELHKMKKPNTDMFSKAECIVKNGDTPNYQFPVFSNKTKFTMKEPRPTRYELPEELDEEHLFDNSFTSISYGSKPLMTHPETSTKQYCSKRINLFDEGSSSSRFMRVSANDVVECRKISSHENIFLDSLGDSMQDDSMGPFQSTSQHIKEETKDTSQLFDQILENKPSKITIETKNNAQAQNLDHAKIISEVLKKYPHLVKNNKNIKLKILNTTKTKKSNVSSEEKLKSKSETPTEEKSKPYQAPDFTYQSDVINSKEAAKLIALGAENTTGPWICLICGTPGKALHFTSYFNFRKHLVEVHNEKPIPTMCEYCGIKSLKRNYLVHHKLTKHGITPPAAYTFPKCNHCDYIALNEALLVKHKSNHNNIMYKCLKYNVPSSPVAQKNTKKYLNQSTDKKIGNLQCVFCLRTFQRLHNLYAHLKTNHKEAAKTEGLIDDSEDEQEEEKISPNLKINSNESSDNIVKVEVPVTFDNTYEDVDEQYQIEQKPDGSICVSTKKPRVLLPSAKNKILNLGFGSPQQSVSSVTHPQKTESMHNTAIIRNEIPQNTYQSNPRSTSTQETVVIDNEEYILQNNQLFSKKGNSASGYLVHSANEAELQTIMPTTSVEYNIPNSNPERKMFIKKSTHMNQPYQIVVSSEEEYKALMNSNQSLLYDEGQPNQTLCELEAPDNSSLATGAIDLDNTQPNDMMIIPDYHMNVPVTVAADNSNIVVVYSHPLEDQSKQFSIITTQGEFVQSSSLMTQNYDTGTTCPPVVTPHTAIENTWQSNIHATINKLPITSTADIQTTVVGESLTVEPIENIQNNSLDELAEVQLNTTRPVTLEVAQTETCINSFNDSSVITTNTQQCVSQPICQPNDVVTIADPIVLSNMQQQVQIQSLPSTNLDQIASISSYSQTSVDTPEEQNTISHEVTSNYHDQSSTVNTIDQQTTLTHDIVTTYQEVEPVVVEEILYQNNNGMSSTQVTTESNETCESILDDADTQVNNIQDSTQENQQLGDHIKVTLVEDEETIENIARDIDESRNASVKEGECTGQSKNEITLTEIAKEQIQNLTSEWSEDEADIILTEQSDVPNANSELQNDNTSELGEESIENIQKEVNKQIAGVVVATVPNDSKAPQTKASDHVAVESQEKISSLLNDWDDNDSQEEIKAATDTDNDNPQSSNIATQDENISTVDNNATTETVDTSEVNKDDNIKRLVSDWDEDDEEENKD